MSQSPKTKGAGFSLADTSICKGIAVLMMLFHHLFNDYPEYAGYTIDYSPLTGDQVTVIAILCKLCVAVFVFITGYGLAASFGKSFEDRNPTPQELARFSLRRWWRLMTNFWPIYLLAVAFGFLGRSAIDVYGPGIRSIAANAMFDFLGLAKAFSTPTLNPTWWYVSLAILLIFVAPFAMSAARKFGSLPLLITGVLGIALFAVGTDAVFLYAASYLLGIFCHENDILGSWDNWLSDMRGGRAIKTAFSGALFLALLSLRNSFDHYGVIDALLALLLCMFVMSCLRSVPVISHALSILGNHSSNMFFTHTLLYSYYFLGFYYSLRFPIAVLAALAVSTLLLSIILEKVKQVTGYNDFMTRIGERLLSRVIS